MADIPVSAAANISERVVDRGISQAYYMCCFNDIVADFEDEKKDLVAKKQSVQDSANQALNRTENISIDVRRWLEKAGSLIEEDTKTKRTCLFRWFPNFIWRYRRGKDLRRKTHEINKLLGYNVFEKFSLPSRLPDVEYHSSKEFVQFQSRSSAYKRLLETLKDVDKYVIGLQGMGGAGKTTLAIEVGKEVKELKLFEHVIKVMVSNPPIIKNIQHEIASPLGLKLEDEHELDRTKRLWNRLTNGEKILIILDDLWERLNFEEIGIPSCGDHNSCRVLLTTRDINVCKLMGCSATIELELLSEQDAWFLFRKCAGLGEGSPKTLENKGQEIAKECKGLPVAIAAIASTLKGEEEKEWDLALRSFKIIDHNDEDLIKVYKRLQVSYDYLKGKEAQELFLLCSVFPEDYEISLEDLTIYAIGLGLCEEVNSFEKARDRLHRAKKKLIDSCLLLKVNQKECVKMHDLLHDLAHWMEKGKIKVIVEPENDLNVLQDEAIEQKSTLKYLYCHNTNHLPNLLECPKLEVLILKHCYEVARGCIPDTFFEGMRSLKVCTLDGYSFGQVPSLPKSIESLKNLQTLTIRDSTLGDMSILKDLQRLKSLRLEGCSINEVPSGIVQLKKLKLLSLKECEIANNPCEVVGQIVPQLEELYFMVDHSLYGKADNEVAIKFLNKNRHSPPLQRYHIDLVGKYGLSHSMIGSTSRALSVAHFGTSTSNTTIKDLMKRAEILHLHKIQEGYKTIVPDLVEAIGDMNELIKIKLESCSEIEFLVDATNGCTSVGNVFSKLIRTDLIGMGHLKGLCCGPPPSNFLENLQEMKIDECFHLGFTLFMGNLQLRRLGLLYVHTCPNLKSLFTLPIAQSLVLLEKLTISNCKALKSIITNEIEKNGKEIIENDPDQLRLFPELKCLEIKVCPQFEGMMSIRSNERQLSDVSASSESQTSDPQSSHFFDTPPYPLKQSLVSRNIRKIRIVRCHKLTSLFTISVVHTMLLEELVINSCDGLEHLITDDSNGHDQKKYDSVMPKLKYLRVYGCSQLKHVFGQSHHENYLSYPYHNIQIQIDFPALEHLILFHLPNIISICQNNYHPKLLALQKFHLTECPQFTITSMSDFMDYSVARELDCSTGKDLGVTTRYMQTVEHLWITRSKIEGIFSLEGLEVSGQHVITRLKFLMLQNLSGMIYIFKGPKYTLGLECLATLSLKGCGKLKIVIPTTLVRSLPQLQVLSIINCSALEQIVEEDEENQNISNPCFHRVCFPELKIFSVKNCRKLKRLLCMNTPNEFPKLEEMIIMEACHLEEVFGGRDQCERAEAIQKNVLPKLKLLILVELPSLTDTELYNKLQGVEHRFVVNCPKLSLTSTITVEDLRSCYEFARSGLRFGQFELQLHCEYVSLLRGTLKSIEDFQNAAESEWNLCTSQIESVKRKGKNIVGEIGITVSEKPTMASASTSSELLKMSSASTSARHDNVVGKGQLMSKACLVDQQLAIEKTETNKETAEHDVKNCHVSEKVEVRNNDGETMRRGVREIGNPSSAPSFIPPKEFALSKKGSVQEGSTSQTARIVTSFESNRLTPNLLGASLCGTYSQGFVEQGSKEPISMDAIGEDKSTNEADERLGKPSDVVENKSLQDEPQKVDLPSADLDNGFDDQDNDEEEATPVAWKRTTITASRRPQYQEKDTSNEHSKQKTLELQNIEVKVAKTAEVTVMAAEHGIYDELDHLECILSGAPYESASICVDTLATQSQRKEDVKAALNYLEELMNKDVDEVYNNHVEISKLTSALSFLETANEFNETVGIKSFVTKFRESYSQLFDKYTSAKSIESKFKALEKDKEAIRTFTELARSQRQQLEEKIVIAEAELQSTTEKILQMKKALADLDNQHQWAANKVTTAKSEKDELQQRSMEMIARATEVMSQLKEAEPTYEQASSSLVELRNSWNDFRLTFLCNIRQMSRD